MSCPPGRCRRTDALKSCVSVATLPRASAAERQYRQAALAKRRKEERNTSRSSSVRTRPFRVLIQSSDQTFAHPKCYARCLGNCSPKISGEHYFTHAVLRRLAVDPRGVYLKGAPWQPDGMWIPPDNLTAAVLCGRHNSQLSPLDDFAASLDDELVRIHQAAAGDHVVSTVIRFYGPNLERWLMKSLCGFVAARPSVFLRSDASPPVPDTWVRYLFGDGDLVAPAGLHLSPKAGESRDVDPNGVTFTSLHARGEVSGLMLDMRILRFTFISIPWQGTIRGVLDESSVRRPRRVSIRSHRTGWCLDFDWPGDSGPETRFQIVIGDAA
jgi:hypothetical protein